MNGIFHLKFLGLFGNSCVQYLFARGYCEKHGLELHCDHWMGERIFDISNPRYHGPELPAMEENEVHHGWLDVSYRSYSQSQKCADFYTRTKARQWLKFRPEIEEALKTTVPMQDAIYAHLRRGDFAGYGYPLVSRKSAEDMAAMIDHTKPLLIVSDENPLTYPDWTGELGLLPDFYRLCRAPILLRGNSTFSFLAGILNPGRVFAPIIDGKEGGKEHHCIYVEGNWPRLSDFGFVTNMHVKP